MALWFTIKTATTMNWKIVWSLLSILNLTRPYCVSTDWSECSMLFLVRICQSIILWQRIVASFPLLSLNRSFFSLFRWNIPLHCIVIRFEFVSICFLLWFGFFSLSLYSVQLACSNFLYFPNCLNDKLLFSYCPYYSFLAAQWHNHMHEKIAYTFKKNRFIPIVPTFYHPKKLFIWCYL